MANGEAQLVQAIHQLRPAPGEADAGFLARILADISAAAAISAGLILHWRDGRITQAEIVLTPATCPQPGPAQNMAEGLTSA